MLMKTTHLLQPKQKIVQEEEQPLILVSPLMSTGLWKLPQNIGNKDVINVGVQQINDRRGTFASTVLATHETMNMLDTKQQMGQTSQNKTMNKWLNGDIMMPGGGMNLNSKPTTPLLRHSEQRQPPLNHKNKILAIAAQNAALSRSPVFQNTHNSRLSQPNIATNSLMQHRRRSSLGTVTNPMTDLQDDGDMAISGTNGLHSRFINKKLNKDLGNGWLSSHQSEVMQN